MLDCDLLAQREVELVLVDERFRQVDGQLQMTRDRWEGTRTEALVADRITLGDAEGERGVLVEREVGGVVVVHHDRDVGLQALQPFAHRHVRIEKRLPRRFLRPIAINHWPDRRDVGKAETADDPAHQRAPLILRVARNCS